MTKKYSVKKALAASLVALVICFSMLVGTTFAWFTDSVTSANNIIQSGNLDVEMYWADGTKAVPADDSADWIDASQGAIFDYANWESGYAAVRHIKIENKGSLALKYMVKIVANGEVSDLADVIDVYYFDGAVQIADRAALTNANKIGTLTDVLANLSNTANGELLAGENDTITLALKMQENAGNEYQNKSLGTTFSVRLLATQLAAENDSFGDQYDADADYAVSVDTQDELVKAIALGGNIVLENDIAIDAPIDIPNGVSVNLNLNGKTLTAPSTALWAIQNMGTLTIKGNGTIEGSYTALYSNGNLTIENGTFTATDGMGVLIDNIYGTETSVAVINGGTFTGIGIYNPADVTVNGGTFNVGRDPDGATDHLSDKMTLFINPTFVGAPNTANVVLNGGTFNGDVYVYDDGVTETVFVNNGATITGDVLDNG